MIESWNVAGGILEYIDETHTYIFNGKILPSITQILKLKFGRKYDGISKDILKRAAEKGTLVHECIEKYEKQGIIDESCIELRNYMFLKRQFNFKCLYNEIPIVLFFDDEPIAAGRVDLVLEEDGNIGICDIKRTSTFDKEYVGYQTNLYRIGYQQSYKKEISFLRGLHLKDNIRKYITIPINEELPLELVKKYLKENNDE